MFHRSRGTEGRVTMGVRCFCFYSTSFLNLVQITVVSGSRETEKDGVGRSEGGTSACLITGF